MHKQTARLSEKPENAVRNNWSRSEVQALFELPFNELLFKAQCLHRENFDPNAVQVSTLLSIKTGGCPEDCHYCNEITDYEINSSNYQLKIKTYIVLVIHPVEAFSDLSSDCESYWYTATEIPPIPLDYYGPISMRAPPVNI